MSRALRHACCARQAAPVNKGWASSQQCCPFSRRLKLPHNFHSTAMLLAKRCPNCGFVTLPDRAGVSGQAWWPCRVCGV